MVDQPTTDDILAAINDSGYLMEQEVASELESLSFHVHTNRAFEDADEGKSRELDVAAIRQLYSDDTQQLSLYVELLCECKNSSNPFVFLLRPQNEADKHRPIEEVLLPRTEFLVPVKGNPNVRTVVSAIDHLGIRGLRPQADEPLKAVQFTKVLRDKAKWVANHAGLYDAIFYPLVKALLARRSEIANGGGNWSYVWLFYPLVVTSGALYTIDTSVPAAKPVATEHVSFTRHIRARGIDGYFTVDFVTRSGLKNFVANRVEPFGRGVLARLKASPNDFRKVR